MKDKFSVSTYAINIPNTLKISKYQQYFHSFIVCIVVPYLFIYLFIYYLYLQLVQLSKITNKSQLLSKSNVRVSR